MIKRSGIDSLVSKSFFSSFVFQFAVPVSSVGRQRKQELSRIKLEIWARGEMGLPLEDDYLQYIEQFLCFFLGKPTSLQFGQGRVRVHTEDCGGDL